MTISVRDSHAPEDRSDEAEVASERARVDGGGPKPGRTLRMPLRALRFGVGKSEGDVAVAIGIPLAEVLELEGARDALVGELQRYAEALGARCEVSFVWDATGHKIAVDLNGGGE